MKQDIIDENLDALESLEYTIVQLWRQNPKMSDYVVQGAYDAAIQFYRAELRGHVPKPPVFRGLDATAFELVRETCEFLLGRRPQSGSLPEPMPLATLLDCLRELSKSVKRHTEIEGRQGYLRFIDMFLP
ncbi:MAG: hypothetical protein JWQ04_122 [Pedosphaera sp.]|nr:hypothetical protein [Pedosphaera sp.]